MARPLRLQIADAIYHVTARGNERALICLDQADRDRFFHQLAEVRESGRWRILAYCLMPNHYHLLVQTPLPNLADGMRELNGIYAQAFNRRHERVGHLFQGRYGSRLVRSDEQLHTVIPYIVRNPVRAGLCRQPGEWPWSSHRAALGEEDDALLDVPALLSYYDPAPEVAGRLYREHTEREDEAEPDSRTLPMLLATHAGDAGIAVAREQGFSLREIARQLGVNVSTVSRRLKRAGATMGSDPTVA